MATQQKYDWDKIETLFITGDMSLKELAETESVIPTTLYTRSSDYNWTEKRQEYKDSIKQEQIQIARKDAIDDKSKFDTMTDRACNVASAMVAKRLTDSHNDPVNKPITSGELKTMMDTVRTTQEIKYRRHDIPAPKQSIDLGGKDPFRDYQLQLAIETARIKEVDGGNGADESDRENGGLVPVKLEMPVTKN